ncbi:mucin-like protein [Branchiostoma floridae]|uniref:Mucin-like protein n=1 Tax=Branchiostoma floridae TaxID=7739 RepID=A0A9J7KKX7_BRAFL|nr:mucin-like protein [Branchiostoma floridae]
MAGVRHWTVLGLFLWCCSAVMSQTTLRGPEGSVCTFVNSRQVSYQVELRRKRTTDFVDYIESYLGLQHENRVPRSLVTRYQTEYFTDYECCVGWNRIADICRADCHNPCVNGLCVNTNVCECDEGWEGGQCDRDVDECWFGIAECDHTCINTDGSFICSCDPGFHLISETRCEEEVDVDECATGNGDCEQNCVNTYLSYHCTCNDGYTLGTDGHSCNEDDMYPYGEEVGEEAKTWEFLKTCKKVELPLEGFRFFTRRHHKIYICDNGVVQFDSNIRPATPLKLDKSAWFKKAALAPYLSKSDPTLLNGEPERLKTKFYYKSYERGDGNEHTDAILEQASADGRSTPGYHSPAYEPVWAMVITWANVPPDCSVSGCPVESARLRRNTFQLAISTDGTHSFATFVYPQRKQEWFTPDEATTPRGTRSNVTTSDNAAVAGYSAGDGTSWAPGNVKGMSSFSGTKAMTTLFRRPPNRAGYWKFALQEQAATPAPAEDVVSCSAWIRQQEFDTPTTLPGYHELPRPGSCPCNLEQAYHDRRYRICIIPARPETYSSKIGARDRIGKGILKSGHAGGHLVVNNQNEDREAYQHCCVGSSSYYCDRFKQLRPFSVPTAGSGCTNYYIGCDFEGK